MTRDLALLATSFVLLTNPVAHVVRAVDEVPYASWHPINLLVVASLVFLVVAWGVRQPGPVKVATAWPMLVIAVFAACTAPWSVSPARSLGWAVHLGFMSVVASTVARQFPGELIRRAALVAVGALLLLCFVMIAAAPEYGTSDEALYRGAWRGVFAGKNHLGLIAAVGVLLSLISEARWRFIVLAASLITLVQTRSGGGMLMVASGTAMLGVVRSLEVMPERWRRGFCVALGAGTVMAAVAGWVFWPALSATLGRDVSLSGRTVLWSHVVDRIAERPLTGHGFRAYFEGDLDHRALQAEMNDATAKGRTFSPPRTQEMPQPTALGSAPAPTAATSSSAPEMQRQVRLLPEPKWRIHNAHNGLLAMGLDLGVPMTVFFLVFVAWQCAPAIALVMRGAARRDEIATVMLVAALFAHNCVEVSVLRSWHPEALLFLLVLMGLFSPRVGSGI